MDVPVCCYRLNRDFVCTLKNISKLYRTL